MEKKKTALEALAGGALQRLQAGKHTEQDLKGLREALEEVPALWHAAGDMAAEAQAGLIRDAAGDNILVRETMVHGCQAIRRGLGHDESPMLEQLLIEAVVLSWLRWSIAEIKYNVVEKKELSVSHSDYWDRHLGAAQLRYLRALTALARIRKMDLPALQINIGDQQVNIAGGIPEARRGHAGSTPERTGKTA